MKWNPYVKLYFIVLAIAVVLIALACIFFWEWDGLIYFIWIVFGVVAVFYKIAGQELFK